MKKTSVILILNILGFSCLVQGQTQGISLVDSSPNNGVHPRPMVGAKNRPMGVAGRPAVVNKLGNKDFALKGDCDKLGVHNYDLKEQDNKLGNNNYELKGKNDNEKMGERNYELKSQSQNDRAGRADKGGKGGGKGR